MGIGGEHFGLIFPVKRAHRPECIGTDQGGADLVDPQSHGGKAGGIDLDADGGLLGPVDRHFGHSGHLCYALGNHAVGNVIEIAGRD